MSAQQPSTSEANSCRKATLLFCPSCGRESDVIGDWTVQTVYGRQIYHCPVCSTTTTKRLQGAPLMAPND